MTPAAAARTEKREAFSAALSTACTHACPSAAVFFQMTSSRTTSMSAALAEVTVAPESAPVTVSVPPEVQPRMPPPVPLMRGSTTRKPRPPLVSVMQPMTVPVAPEVVCVTFSPRRKAPVGTFVPMGTLSVEGPWRFSQAPTLAPERLAG